MHIFAAQKFTFSFHITKILSRKIIIKYPPPPQKKKKKIVCFPLNTPPQGCPKLKQLQLKVDNSYPSCTIKIKTAGQFQGYNEDDAIRLY